MNGICRLLDMDIRTFFFVIVRRLKCESLFHGIDSKFFFWFVSLCNFSFNLNFDKNAIYISRSQIPFYLLQSPKTIRFYKFEGKCPEYENPLIYLSDIHISTIDRTVYISLKIHVTGTLDDGEGTKVTYTYSIIKWFIS